MYAFLERVFFLLRDIEGLTALALSGIVWGGHQLPHHILLYPEFRISILDVRSTPNSFLLGK